MDFELFNLDEDDELLSTACLEVTQQDQRLTSQQTQVWEGASEETVLPEFQCSGEDTMHSQFAAEGFVKSGFMLNKPENAWRSVCEQKTLTDFEFGVKHLHGHEMVEFLCGRSCMHIQHLWVSVRQPLNTNESTQSYYQRRQQVTHLFYLLLHHTHEEQWPLLRTNLDSMRRLLNRTTEMDTWKLIYFANSCKGNECNAAAYHMLHGAFEWKLLDLCILYKFELCATMTHLVGGSKPGTNFLCQLERIFDDLVTCSLYLYAKKRPAELLFSSPFPCTCIKECWLYVQLALQKWMLGALTVTGEQITFWQVFNGTLIRLKTKLDKFSLTNIAYAEFANWLLHALVRLFGYRSNGQFVGPTHERATADTAENFEELEQFTQQFLNGNPSEEQTRIFICLLMPTLLHWWRPRASIPMLLWEHFHKRLNASFYAAGAAPSNLAVACANGKAYVERYRALLMQEEDSTPDANLSSYTLFTLLLGKNLRRLLESASMRHQAQKLLGRIYTKFSTQKFLALNETGIHHLIELFLALALCGDFQELAPKLSTKLLSIALDKIPAGRQIAITKGHMALLILYAERHCEIGEYVTKLLQQLAAINNDLGVSKVLADALLDIFMQADDFRRGEHLLIDAWLPNFLQSCTPVEQDRSLEALHLIFDKLQRNEALIEANSELFRTLNTHLLPFVKQQFACGYSQWLPQLAADFCTHACTVPDTQTFQKLFTCFIEAPVACRQSLPQFLNKVLQTERATLIEPNVVIHVWLKSLVQLTALNEDVAQLTRFVVQLAEFRMMTDNLNADELMQAKEPLCVFIAAVGKYYDACAGDGQCRFRIADNLNAYLRHFDKWLHADLKQEKTEVAFRFYSFLAIVIYNCVHIVYTKSKVNCFFHVVMTRFVLPTNVQMGKAPDVKLAQLIHKIWPVLVQGIGRLNFKADPYISKTLTDLIQKWTPHFKISPNAKVVARPFVSCLQSDNAELSLFVFEKLTSLFLATQRRQADPNACLVITIFQEVVDSIDASNSSLDVQTLRLETFMKATSLLMLEHIMMVDEVVPSRALMLDLFKRIVNSCTYKRSHSLPALLAEHLRLLTKKHLPYYTFFFFELLQRLAQFMPQTILQIMDFLVAEVCIVEQKRGAGEDNRMRGCLQKLQQCLKCG